MWIAFDNCGGWQSSDREELDQIWVSVAQDKKSLRKYEVEISTKGGKQKVEIPDAVVTDSTPLWDDFVIGKFLDLAPHLAKVHMVLNKIWRYGDLSAKVEVYEVMRQRCNSKSQILKLERRF